MIDEMYYSFVQQNHPATFPSETESIRNTQSLSLVFQKVLKKCTGWLSQRNRLIMAIGARYSIMAVAVSVTCVSENNASFVVVRRDINYRYMQDACLQYHFECEANCQLLQG